MQLIFFIISENWQNLSFIDKFYIGDNEYILKHAQVLGIEQI